MKSFLVLLFGLLSVSVQGCSGPAYSHTCEEPSDFQTSSVGFCPPFHLTLTFATTITSVERQLLTTALQDAFERQHIALAAEGYAVGVEITQFKTPDNHYAATVRLSCGSQFALQGGHTTIPAMANHVAGAIVAQIVPPTD